MAGDQRLILPRKQVRIGGSCESCEPKSVQFTCRRRRLLGLFQHLQRSVDGVAQAQCRTGTATKPAARYEFDFDTPIRQRVQDTACQLYLNLAAHYPMRWRHVEVDDRRGIDVFINDEFVLFGWFGHRSLSFRLSSRSVSATQTSRGAPLTLTCVYRKLKPGRSDDEVRQGWVVNE
jgi:hypothetical protein